MKNHRDWLWYWLNHYQLSRYYWLWMKMHRARFLMLFSNLISDNKRPVTNTISKGIIIIEFLAILVRFCFFLLLISFTSSPFSCEYWNQLFCWHRPYMPFKLWYRADVVVLECPVLSIILASVRQVLMSNDVIDARKPWLVIYLFMPEPGTPASLHIFFTARSENPFSTFWRLKNSSGFVRPQLTARIYGRFQIPGKLKSNAHSLDRK